MKYLKYSIFALVIMGLASCNQTEPTSTVSPEIENIGWVIGNISSNYWLTGPKPSAIIELSIRFQDNAIKATDLKSVIITNSLAPEYQWSYDASKLIEGFYTSPSTGKKAVDFGSLWTPNIASNASVIYLGTYTIKVELKNGKTAIKKLVTPAPNSLNAGGYSYTYSSEDYIGIPPSNFVALPKRATIQSASLNTTGDTLNIEFSVDDNKIYSGWVIFYNKDRNRLGIIKDDFRDFSDRTINAKLNNGTIFNTDGQSNVLELKTNDIFVYEDIENFSLTDIVAFQIILTDGKQYEGTDSLYDTYSLSVGTLSE